jgi:hypothetical protein
MYIGSIKMKFLEFWSENNLAFGIFVVLDPYFKLELVDYMYEQIYNRKANFQLLWFLQDHINVYNKYSNWSNNLRLFAPTTTDGRLFLNCFVL